MSFKCRDIVNVFLIKILWNVLIKVNLLFATQFFSPPRKYIPCEPRFLNLTGNVAFQGVL